VEADGIFLLSGLPTGSYRVTVQSDATPAMYADPNTSPFKLEVKEGKNVLNIELK
jgi:hypothetical protein